MKKKNNKNVGHINETEFGEFICTFHQWLPIDEQKNNAEKLENITNEKKQDNDR